jgi:hypothetical protein
MSNAKSKANPHREPIPLTGRVWVTGALANEYPSRELTSTSKPQKGDLKLWCHKFKDAKPVGSGLFRAAVFDGTSFRTFRLNIIADSDARYGDYSDWQRKAARTIRAMADQKARPAHWRNNTYGVVFSIKADPPPPVNAPKSVTPADGAQSQASTVPATAPVPASTPVTEAARQATVPATARDTKGRKGKVSRRGRGRKRYDDPNQLKLGFASEQPAQ